MKNVEKWYLTRKGWLRSSAIDPAAMENGRDVFEIVESVRNGFLNHSTVVWDTAACDLDVEMMKNHLVREFGERPSELSKWYAEYSGLTF